MYYVFLSGRKPECVYVYPVCQLAVCVLCDPYLAGNRVYFVYLVCQLAVCLLCVPYLAGNHVYFVYLVCQLTSCVLCVCLFGYTTQYNNSSSTPYIRKTHEKVTSDIVPHSFCKKSAVASHFTDFH